MTTLAPALIETFEAALQTRFILQPLNVGRWQLTSLSAPSFSAEAKLQGEWLTLNRTVSDDGRTPWDRLVSPPTTPARYCRSWGMPLSMQAEVLIVPDVDPDPAVAAAADAFTETTHEPAPLVESLEPVDLARLCTEAGWHGTSRTSGAVGVPLEDREGLQAVVEEAADHRIMARLSLMKLKTLSDVSREAIARLLLEVAGQVRSVCPRADVQPERVEILLEVGLTAAATSNELDAALGALCVAGARCAREVRALADETVAQQYLQVRGWSSSQVTPG